MKIVTSPPQSQQLSIIKKTPPPGTNPARRRLEKHPRPAVRFGVDRRWFVRVSKSPSGNLGWKPTSARHVRPAFVPSNNGNSNSVLRPQIPVWRAFLQPQRLPGMRRSRPRKRINLTIAPCDAEVPANWCRETESTALLITGQVMTEPWRNSISPAFLLVIGDLRPEEPVNILNSNSNELGKPRQGI